MGAATITEVEVINQNLKLFCMCSGQRIGPAKSKLWFSKKVTPEEVEAISEALGVPRNAQSEMYLGAPIKTNRESFDFLIEKFSQRLQAWKGRLLTQAGRIVLIQSVLQSLPVYYMSTVTVPAHVIQTLTGMMRRFLWGACDKERFMSYVSWEKITRPKELGGLGLRSLKEVNEALLLKSLWKLAAGSTSPWAKVVTAKYLPRSDLWHSKRTYRCSTFWRNIMALRPKLLPLLTWKLGDGGTCTVFAQPWYQGGVQKTPTCQPDRHLKVQELVNDARQWDAGRIVELLGYQACITILASVKPPVQTGGRDKLIFTPAKDGLFSVKKAYSSIKAENPTSAQPDLMQKRMWRAIWEMKEVQPRVRVFLWKVLNEGLPLAGILAHRIGKGDPLCAMCGEEEETMAHMLFHCNFARRCWLSCPTPLLTSNLPTQLREIFQQCLLLAPKDQWSSMANTMWALWRCRNDCTYEGIKPSHQTFMKYLSNIATESWLASNKPQNSAIQVQTRQQEEERYEYTCYVDGAWIQPWRGGVGFLIYKQGELEVYRTEGILSCCAIQSEATALLHAIRYVEQQGLSPALFYSDSLELVNHCKDNSPPVNADWRVAQEIYQCWMAIRRNKNFAISHVSRSHNELADILAKKGRREGADWSYTGHTFPLF